MRRLFKHFRPTKPHLDTTRADMARTRSFRGLIRDRAGIAAVEFAAAAPFLVALVLGVFEFGRGLWMRNVLQYAAEETGHYAMVHAGMTVDSLESYTKDALAAASVNPNDVTVTADFSTTDGVEFVTLTATYPFHPTIAFVSLGTITLVGRSRVPAAS
jgi:Flp pilus assembly protein TadG